MAHERPELTTIPADSFWPKGDALEQSSYSSHERRVTRAVEDAGEACLQSTDVPERLRERIRPLLETVVDEIPLGRADHL
ncbi:hypothetical protein [Streptomyces sp. NPDC051183]|uniref:hypothetical protein n=1 Tax=unclassified Streptomyces TaxID=2593676 RepID=UPI0034171D36